MKKLLIVAAIIMALIIPGYYVAAELNNITAQGVNGDLCFYNGAGNEVFCIESTNRLVTYPTGSGVDVESGASLKIAGTAVTSTAAELNKLASLSGDVLSTTNAKTVTNKTLSGATLTGTITGGTFTNSTMTSPVVNWGISPKTFIAGEDWTLSAAEAKSVLLTLVSGSGTPSIIDASSTSGALKIIRNAANVAVTCKMSGQTGVSVASGTTAVLINSGTDYVRVTADAAH